jgi:hypothetical protein
VSTLGLFDLGVDLNAPQTPRLSEFPIFLKQALKFILHSHIVCFMKLTR